MNMSINKIMDSCAQANVLYSGKEIEAMLRKEIPMAKPVGKIIQDLKTNIPIKSPEEKYEKYNTDWRGMKWAHDAILEIMKTRHLTRNQFCEELKLDPRVFTDLICRLRRAKKIRSKGKFHENRVFGLIDDDSIELVDTDTPRQKAAAMGLNTYHASVHDVCGTTEKYTNSKSCVMCQNGWRKQEKSQ
jgi:hypothetical protein